MLDCAIIFFQKSRLGPFVGNTSHPILLIGNTAGAWSILSALCLADAARRSGDTLSKVRAL